MELGQIVANLNYRSEQIKSSAVLPVFCKLVLQQKVFVFHDPAEQACKTESALRISSTQTPSIMQVPTRALLQA